MPISLRATTALRPSLLSISLPYVIVRMTWSSASGRGEKRTMKRRTYNVDKLDCSRELLNGLCERQWSIRGLLESRLYGILIDCKEEKQTRLNTGTSSCCGFGPPLLPLHSPGLHQVPHPFSSRFLSFFRSSLVSSLYYCIIKFF